MSGDPTVLGMIDSKLNDISCDLKDIKGDLKEGAVRMENHNVRLKEVEDDVKDIKNGQKKIKEAIFTHANTKELHYNQGYKETIPQRAWRKKEEITIISVIMTVTSLVLNYFFG